MQVIKKFFLTLYIIFLGVIVFCNTSVFGADSVDYQQGVYVTTNDIDNYFINVQDYFDNLTTRYNNLSGYSQFNDLAYTELRYNLNYFVELKNDSVWENRGFTIYFYSLGNSENVLSTSSTFYTAELDNYFNQQHPAEFTSLNFQGMRINYNYKVDITNGSNTFTKTNVSGFVVVPLSVVNYHHNIYFDYFSRSTTNGASQVTNAIYNQTNTIKEETQKQTNAVVSATQSQTNQLLDTNNTGNETMSVNDTTTDTSADLSSIYNNISTAFTSYDPTISWGKDFVFTLPNGDNFTINLDSSLILNFLDDYPVLKAFYQSIFWVIFGGYVIFDFKKIINKMKEGNIDNVVGTSSPVDSVVNMSLK